MEATRSAFAVVGVERLKPSLFPESDFRFVGLVDKLLQRSR
jgi:hypothetical protein